MSLRTALAGLGLTLLLCASADAASPNASGSVVINGKTITLAHGRAWQNGAIMGVPLVSIILAEKPLDDLDWSNGDSNFSEGQRGVALRIDPTPDVKNERGQEPYRYAIDADYEIQIHAADYRSWYAAALTAALELEDITVTDGWVRGKIEWQGSLPNPLDSEQIITAISATFLLPMGEIRPLPKE